MSTLHPKQSFYLIDDMGCPRSGWDRDFRGSDHYPYKEWGRLVYVNSVNTDYPCSATREVTRQTSGKVTFETSYNQKSGDGVYLGFYDKKEEALRIDVREGFVYADGKKLFATTNAVFHHIKFILDIDRGVSKIFHDGKFMCEIPFTGTSRAIENVTVGYQKQDLGYTELQCCKMYKNYLVNDFVIAAYNGELPDDYTVEKTGKSKIFRRQYGNLFYNYVYSIEASKESCTAVSRSFDRTDEKIRFELKYIVTKKQGQAKISLTCQGKSVITLNDSGDGLCHGDNILRKHSAYNVWQTLRLDADPVSQTALVYLNGKKLTYLNFDNPAQYFDGFRIEFCAFEKASEFMFGEIQADVLLPEPADYCPEPVIPKKKGDYYVGMNICSLWRDGQHHGWDCITGFEDHVPVLGFYDEGIPETADWEIKFMAEHGIDFQLYCWYADNVNLPLMCPRMHYQWNNAHMYAKYSDKVKFALLWEAACNKPDSFESFKKYYVPYWIDYYFSDERYMTIDGYAIMSIYGSRQLISHMGSVEITRKCLDYLRREVKRIGYKGLIIMACGDPDNNTKALGIDGTHAYNWGYDGYDLEYTKQRNLNNIKSGIGHQVPTISSGYNVVAWREYRSPNMTPEDTEKGLTWIRDEILPTFDKKSWKSKLTMLSTWNEYGEGTYMAPSSLYGFGYLDAVRKVFCEDMPHTDISPTEKQKESFCLLHPKDRFLLAPLHYVNCDSWGGNVLRRYEFKTKEDLDKWEFFGFSDYEIKDGVLIGHSDSDFPYMLLKETKETPISTAKVYDIRAMHRSYKLDEQMCSITIGFTNEKNPASSLTQVGAVSNPKERVERYLGIRERRVNKFKGDIYNFRVRPVWSKGYFELESIEFLDSARKSELYIDNEFINMYYDLIEKNGSLYIPFDITYAPGRQKCMCHKWDKSKRQFTVFSHDTFIFTIGSDKVLCESGTVITLPEPLELYDGLPLLPIDIYAKILGKKLTVDGMKVYID